MRVGLDITAMEVGFKRHASRGIGRYASELSSRLLADAGPSRHADVTIAPFRQTALPLPGWLEGGVRLLGEHRDVARQHRLFSGMFADSLAKRFDMLHFLSQLDAPAWCALPPLEACTAGVPVVSSNRSCLPETLGDRAILCDPEDHDTFSASLWAILSNPDHAKAVSHRGIAHARTFTRDKTAEGTLAVYERLARERKVRHPARSSG